MALKEIQPAQVNFGSYRDSTFNFSFTLFDLTSGTKTAMDLSVYQSIEYRLFQKKNIDDPDIKLVSGTNLTVNGNELLGEITDEQTKSLFGKVLYHQLLFKLADGSQFYYVAGRFTIANTEGSATQADIEVTVDSVTNEVTIEGLQSVAKAVQAAIDAETAETNAQTSETNAATSATNASTSATNASTSAATASTEADDAEKQAQNTVSFTDSNGVTYDKGAKGWSQDAESFANANSRTLKDPLVPQDAFGIQQEDNTFRKTTMAGLTDVLVLGGVITEDHGDYIKFVSADGGEIINPIQTKAQFDE